MNELEKAKELVMSAMATERAVNSRGSENYATLRSILIELEDVWSLDELSARAKRDLAIVQRMSGEGVL